MSIPLPFRKPSERDRARQDWIEERRREARMVVADMVHHSDYLVRLACNVLVKHGETPDEREDARILLVVSTIPFWFRLTGEAGASSAAATLAGRPHLLDVGLADLGLLAAAAVVGSLVAVRLRLPAATLIGPMIVSAAIHLTGLTASTPPLEAVAVAQVVLGTAIGCRFAGAQLPSDIVGLRWFIGVACRSPSGT